MATNTTREQKILHGLLCVPQMEAIILMEAGYLLLHMGRRQQARDLFTGVLHLAPESDIPHISLGNLFLAEKKFPLALQEYEQALKRNPGSALAYAHIGELKFFEKKFEDGVQALHKAMELEPTGPASLFAKELLHAYHIGFFK